MGLNDPGRAPTPRPASAPANALSIDVEDYFHVEAFSGTIARERWDALPRRVEANTDRLLALLADAEVAATFFTLGWVAERHPALVRRIVDQGHELASHGCEHRRADRQTAAAFRADVARSKAMLEDLGGVPVRGYRAPTFSVGASNPWFHDVLADEGFAYSSSVYPIAHDLYGVPQAPRTPFRPCDGLVEVPLTTMRMLGRNLPAAGGGFFRLLPYPMSRWGLRRAGATGAAPCVFYTHPWEIDPGQPRQAEAPRLARFRHYLNLDRTERRLRRLLGDFTWGRMDEVYLDRSDFPLLPEWRTANAP